MWYQHGLQYKICHAQRSSPSQRYKLNLAETLSGHLMIPTHKGIRMSHATSSCSSIKEVSFKSHLLIIHNLINYRKTIQNCCSCFSQHGRWHSKHQAIYGKPRPRPPRIGPWPTRTRAVQQPMHQNLLQRELHTAKCTVCQTKGQTETPCFLLYFPDVSNAPGEWKVPSLHKSVIRTVYEGFTQ